MLFVRHADSSSNLLSRVDHHRHSREGLRVLKRALVPYPRLSDEGVSQARRLALPLLRAWQQAGSVAPLRLHPSYMMRAVETAVVIARTLHPYPVSIEPWPFCSEIDSAGDVPSARVVVRALGSKYLTTTACGCWRSGGGRRRFGMRSSVERFREWVSTTHQTVDSSVCIVISHGRFIRTALGREAHLLNTAIVRETDGVVLYPGLASTSQSTSGLAFGCFRRTTQES
jgi:broad specificity phosphatase PhoE